MFCEFVKPDPGNSDRGNCYEWKHLQ